MGVLRRVGPSPAGVRSLLGALVCAWAPALPGLGEYLERAQGLGGDLESY